MRILACFVAALLIAGHAHDARAQAPSQAWPTRAPIKVIVPFPPGSALDTIARPVFEQVSKQIGQSFVFESRPGAGGTLGMAAAAKAPADGYTLLVNSSIHTIVPTTFAKLPFDTLREFVAVAPLGQFPNVLVTPRGRFTSVQDMVAKGKAKPGSITYGSGGIGAATHLNAERFRLAAGFEAVHVPFKGAPEAVREVLGGRIDFYFSPLLSVAPLGQFPNVLVTPRGRFTSVQDMVAKGKAKPGSITYGSGGIGAATHLNAERFRLAAGFEAVHVPFKGAPEAVREVLGGRIDFYFSPLLSVVPLIEGKELDGLAVSSLTRDETLPAIPTTLEAGYPNSDYIFWIGVFAPGGTPQEIVDRLYGEIAKTLADPAMKANLKKLGANPMPFKPAEFEAFIRTEIESNAKLIKAAGIAPN